MTSSHVASSIRRINAVAGRSRGRTAGLCEGAGIHPVIEMNMKAFVARSGILALTVSLFALTPASISAQGEVLSNTSVVNMIAGKVSKDLILAKIRGTKSGFDVTAAGLVRLHQSKVP